MQYLQLSLVLLCLVFYTNAQEKKSVEAIRISSPLVIDGNLDEEVYKMATPATDFLQIQPYSGQPALEPTEVYFFYDHTAIYIGAKLYDKPDSIFNFLTERDNIGPADYFGIYIDPYNQGQLAFGFFVTPAGVQIDMKAVTGDYDYEDANWNAVWESAVSITEEGWMIEMRIPFSALRFSENAGSIWGLNMFRNIRRHRSNNSWNYLDRNISGFIHQQGQLTGITDVEPPIRLSFSPYVATYYEIESSHLIYRGGMDVKYGISESFTLDMMLIPDFGQIQSDDKQLNLTPYELYYDEKRQFFTEGTELFQRGNIFYSRRIGAGPKFSPNEGMIEHEMVNSTPTETRLINASKVSGRTKDGWGLGMLNAMSMSSYAEVKDSLTGSTRNVMVQPFTNYNVSVVDKSLKNNSYVSIINTNVSMVDNPFRANVTATEFQLRDKSKSFALNGKGGLSHRGEHSYETGFHASLGVKKNSGELQYGISHNIWSDKYNPNDLGYLRRNNHVSTESYVMHQKVEPFWILMQYNSVVWWNHLRMYSPNTMCNNEVGSYVNVTFMNNYHGNINGGYSTETNDYYEPRVKGRYYLSPPAYWINFNVRSDSRKKLHLYLHYGFSGKSDYQQTSNSGYLEARLRLGQRFQGTYGINMNHTVNDVGFVDKSSGDETIIFAKRNVNTFNNLLSVNYVLNNKAGIRLRVRHHWAGSENKSFFNLLPDGSLLPDPAYTDNQDQNYNAFTVDMIFRWIFAPGSELICAWKNAAFTDHDRVVRNYWDNLSDTWNNQSNSLSLKVLYYIDYNQLKRSQ